MFNEEHKKDLGTTGAQYLMIKEIFLKKCHLKEKGNRRLTVRSKNKRSPIYKGLLKNFQLYDGTKAKYIQ